MKKYEITTQGPQGNAFYVMRTVYRALKAEGAKECDTDGYFKQATLHDYDNLVKVSQLVIDNLNDGYITVWVTEQEKQCVGIVTQVPESFLVKVPEFHGISEEEVKIAIDSLVKKEIVKKTLIPMMTWPVIELTERMLNKSIKLEII